MRFVVLALLAVIAITSALPKNEKDMNVKPLTIGFSKSGLESLVLIILERAREIIQNGIYDFPTLDPFKDGLREIDLSSYGKNESYFKTEGLSSTGLSSFETPELSVTIISNSPFLVKVFLTVEIPQFDAYADSYDVYYGSERLGLSFYGQGIIGVTAKQTRGVFTLIVAPDLDGGIRLSVIDLTASYRIGSFEPRITGLYNNDKLSRLLEIFLRKAVPVVFEVFEELIDKILSPILLSFINIQLEGTDFTDLFT